MEDPLSVLSRWLPDAGSAVVRPWTRVGFSGARLWQVVFGVRRFALRRWPPAAADAERLAAIDALQWRLADCGLPAPRPVLTLAGHASVQYHGDWWSLNEWLPGAADYWTDPRPAKLQAALAMLAKLHLAAAGFPPDAPAGARPPQPSPAMIQRRAGMADLAAGQLADAQRRIPLATDDAVAPLARRAVALVARLAPPLLCQLDRWHKSPLSLQWCLRDVWHDHILFTENVVTGVVDFGAAAVDSPAADVARLLGSLAGDDPQQWRTGLQAYESLRPLTPQQHEAVRLFDVSGTVLAAVNWVNWLFPEGPATGLQFDRSAGIARLERLTTRLQRLADRSTK